MYFCIPLARTRSIYLSYWPTLFRLCSLIHSFISFILLSIASSKASSPQSGIGCSSFHFQYPLFSLRSSSSCLRLFHRLPVTYVCPSIFPIVTHFRRQFLRTMWPIQLTSLRFIVYSIFLSSLTVCNTYSFFTRSAETIFSILPQHQISNQSRYIWSTIRRVQVSAPYKVILQM